MRQWLRAQHAVTRYGLVFLSAAALDAIWALYIQATANDRALLAALLSVITVGLGAFNVLSFVKDRRTVIAACAGAFVGTYLTLWTDL